MPPGKGSLDLIGVEFPLGGVEAFGTVLDATGAFGFAYIDFSVCLRARVSYNVDAKLAFPIFDNTSSCRVAACSYTCDPMSPSEA